MDEKLIEEQLKSMSLKVNRLEGEVDSLRKEVAALKKNKNVVVTSGTSSKPVAHKPVYVPVEERVPALAKKAPVKTSEETVTPVFSEITDNVDDAIKQTSVAEEKHIKEKTSFESKIGKNLMGIVAAILVFAALIVFGGMIFLVIPDGLKVAIMYAISFAFAIFGIKNMNKENKYHAFFSSIAATGVCAIYISSLIAYFAFNILPTPVLISIIVLWLVATGLLSKKKSMMFIYICNVGLIVSTFLIVGKWDAFIMGAILYVLGLGFIYLLNKSESYNRDCHVFIQLVLISMILIIENRQEHAYVAVFYLIVTAIIFLREKIYEINSKNVATYLVTTALWLLLTLSLVGIFNNVDYVGDYSGFIYVIAFSVFALVYYKNHRLISKTLNYIIYYLWVVSLLFTNVGVFKEYISFAIISAAFLIYGSLKKKLHALIPGYCYLLCVLCFPPDAANEAVVDLIIMAVCVALFIYNMKNYYVAFKFILTVLFVSAFCVIGIKNDIGSIPAFLFFAAISLFMNSNFYAKNYKIGKIEKGTVITGYVINVIMMIAATYFIKNVDEPFTIFEKSFFDVSFNLTLVIIIAVALFMINTKRLFDIKILPREFCAVYIGVKFTIFICDILARFEAISFVVSLVLLLFAVGCIIFGFKFKFKGLRLYGLVLTLITVFKIIVADIEYDNFLLRPLGMLGAGLLCFGISWLYSRFEKQTKQSIEE